MQMRLRRTILACVLAIGGITVFGTSSARAQYAIAAYSVESSKTGEDCGEEKSFPAARARAEEILAKKSRLTGKYLYDHVDIAGPDGTITLRREEGNKKMKPKKDFDDPLPKRNPPGDMPPGGPKGLRPKAPVDKNNTNSVAGKMGNGKIGKATVTFTFAEDGSFSFTGKLKGSGTWTQTGKAVTMRTAISTFQGVVKGDTLEGIRVWRSRDGKVNRDTWCLDKFERNGFATPAADAAARDKPAQAVPSIVGTWTTNRGDVRFAYEFNDDNTFEVLVTSPYFNQRKRGRWELRGKTVSARFQASGTPGTGGFSRARELPVKIVARDKMVIDGDTATRK
jgi:hypothetical protein